jgi:hypothetical protein
VASSVAAFFGEAEHDCRREFFHVLDYETDKRGERLIDEQKSYRSPQKATFLLATSIHRANSGSNILTTHIYQHHEANP